MDRGSRIFARRSASRLACAFLLVYQFVFLNIVLPGHTRGAITLSGKSSVASLANLGCPFCARPNHPKKSPTRQDQSDCAICHLAARISPPLVIDFTPPRLGLAEILDPPAPCIALSVRAQLLLRERAPPTAA
jgi:hypothetical protein